MSGNVKITCKTDDNTSHKLVLNFAPENRRHAYARLAKMSNITALRIDDCDLKDEDAKIIADLLPQNKDLSELNLHKNFIGAEGVLALAEAAKELPALRDVNLARNVIAGREGGEAVAALLKNTPQLAELNISSNQLKDEGCAVVGGALKTATQLQKVFVADVNNTDTGLTDLVAGLQNHPHIRSVNIMQDTNISVKIPQKVGIIERVIGSESKNLTQFTPRNDAMDAFCDRNKARAREAASHLEGNLNTLDYTALAAIATRWTIISDMMPYFKPSLDTAKKPLPLLRREFPEFVNSLPRIPQDGTVEALFTANEKGYAPLDNPLIWRKPQVVMDWLESKGQTLTPEFMQRSTPRGVTFEEAAIKAAPLSKLIPALNKAGVQLQENRLLQANGQPTALLNGIIERGDGAQLFTHSNLRGTNAQSMRRMASALPAEQRNRIPLHQLGTMLDMDNRHAGKGR